MNLLNKLTFLVDFGNVFHLLPSSGGHDLDQHLIVSPSALQRHTVPCECPSLSRPAQHSVTWQQASLLAAVAKFEETG